MIEECVIIGGGVAGLSAANQLVNCGISPLIIESGEYPCHRICGEYFSHESLPTLQQWSIPLTGNIHSVRFVKGVKEIELKLPLSAGSCSHFEFDFNLFERALKKGARALTRTTVTSLLFPTRSIDPFELELSDNQIVKARHLIIGTGKLPKIAGINIRTPKMKYIGFKTHFEGIEMGNALEMLLFKGGYLGIANVNPKTTNIAALVNKDMFPHAGDPEKIIKEIIETCTPSLKKRLKGASMIFPKWLNGQVPEFGMRKNPHLERTFWIGDAAGGIPPISGEGLAIAVTSGCMAADYLLNSDARQFRIDWVRRYRKRYFFAQALHRILMQSSISEVGMNLCQAFPFIPLYLWKLTREKAT